MLAVLAAALGSAHVYAQFGAQPAKLSVTKVRDDIFVIQNELVPGNTTVLVTNEGVVLVDDKFDIDSANLLAQLKTITSQPVKYVVNTHYHGDHSGGNAKLQAMGAQAVSSERARAKMVEGKQPGQTNVTFDQQARLYLGGKRVELYYFGRGHTDGDIVALFPEQRVIAMGDLYTVGPGLPPLVDYAGGGSTREWPKTLDGVLRLDFDAVVPGHGPVSKKDELRKYREMVARIGTRVHDMLVSKGTREQVEKTLRSEFGFEDFHIQMSLDGLLVELR